LINLLLSLVTLVVFFASGEAAIRLYRAYQAAQEPANYSKRPGPLELDPKLGWRSCIDYMGQWSEPDSQGHVKAIRYKTGEHGFRMFGNLQTSKTKVFVIGDSCTQARYVSNDETYYSRVAQDLPTEIFAYGCGGYESLQEYMILDQFIDIIDPAIVIWQYSGNDIINNSFELERRSFINNNGMRRPYLTDAGEIAYLYPSNVPLIRRMASESQFLMLLLSRFDKLTARFSSETILAVPKIETIETVIERDGPRHQGFRRAVQLTDEIMKRVRARCRARIVTFTIADSFYVDEFRNISLNNRMEYVDGIQEALKDAEAGGRNIRASDKIHWNEAGHRIVGEKIVAYLKSTGVH